MNPESIRPLHRLRAFRAVDKRWVTSGQPAAEEFALLRDAGFEIVINLALPTSDHALPDEGALVTGLGMGYVHLPVNFEHPAARDFEAFCGIAEAFADRRVFVHCAANMRVSAFVFLHRVLKEGVARDVAEADLFAIWRPNPTWSRFLEDRLAAGR